VVPVAIVATPVVSAAAPAAATPAAAAPVAAVALLATSAGAPGPAPAVPPPPASPGAAGSLEPAFTPRRGVASKSAGLSEPNCICSKDGVTKGQATGQPGCAKHGKEPNANVEAYCFVEGGYECGGAMPSTQFKGLYWVNCEKPNFHLLYPPTCEILKRATAETFVVPPPLNLEAPPPTMAGLKVDMAPLPAEGADEFAKVAKNLQRWDKPMDPIWHAGRQNYFANEAFQDGATMPTSGVNAMSPAAATAIAPAPAILVIGAPAISAPAAASAMFVGAPMPAMPSMFAPAPASAFIDEASHLRGVQKH